MNYGGNRCESRDGTLDDGVLRAEAGQDGAVTMSFQYGDDKSDTCLKLQHTLGELQTYLLMQKNMKWQTKQQLQLKI